MSEKSPVFSSPELRQAIAETRSTLEGFDASRNQVSADIKQLEAYLEGLQLKTAFRYSLGQHYETDDQYFQSHLEFGGSAPATIIEQALMWAEDPRSARFRLMHEIAQWDGSVDLDVPGGPFFRDESTVRREVKPLIEAKFEVRKQLYGRLPDFVRALSERLKVEGLGPSMFNTSLDDPPPPNISLDDPPF